MLLEFGGSGKTSKITKEIHDQLSVKIYLTETDREYLYSGQKRWYKHICWVRYAMVKSGLLYETSKSGRGIWELTNKGEEQAEKYKENFKNL